MKRSSFIHLIGLAAAGLCSSLVARRADASSIPEPTPAQPGEREPLPRRLYDRRFVGIGQPEYAPGSAIALLRQTDLPEPTPVYPAPKFGMFSGTGSRRVWKFTEEWAFGLGLDIQAFEKELLEIRREHPEVFDTAVRESIFNYWQNAISNSPLQNPANRIATLQAEFDRVFVTCITSRHPR